MKNVKNIKTLAAIGVSLAMSVVASQASLYVLDETFQSGATFSGILTFTPGSDNLTAVNGTLTGGSYPTESINWIWNTTQNFAGGYPLGGNFLMSGSGSQEVGTWQDFISVTWNYSAAPALTLVGSAWVTGSPYGNNVDYTDGMVSGSLTPVPEPTTIVAGALMLLPFGSGAVRQFRKKLQAA